MDEIQRKEILEQFGRNLMEEVRDSALTRFNKIKFGEFRSQDALRLHEKIHALDQSSIKVIDDLVLDIIDSTIFEFLRAAEEGCFRIATDETEDISSISDGLMGELFSDKGWIRLYSKFPSSE